MAVISVEDLASTPDDELEQLLYQNIYTLQAEAPDLLDNLSEQYQALFIALLMDAEVNNGGFNQFWFNAPDFAADAAPALTLLGLDDAAALAGKSALAFESVRERHEVARREKSMEAFSATYESSPFKALDDEYFARADEWGKARVAFIRANPHLFVVAPA